RGHLQFVMHVLDLLHRARGLIDRARVGPTMRVLGPAEGFAELPAHRIRLAFAPGERPPALERLGELIAEEFRL
ncbi:hypothetical protein J5291_30865, partial [Pseudomonas aeruginosa]|nr:hypothetical protein [Pseudomonas aeruginosa]